MIELVIAFGAGLISFLSPCVLPLIPGYISYISGASLDELLANKKINLLPLILFTLSVCSFSFSAFFSASFSLFIFSWLLAERRLLVASHHRFNRVGGHLYADQSRGQCLFYLCSGLPR